MQLTIHMSNTERESTVLPHAYQHLIQGMLFNIWKEDPEFAAMLHAVNDDGRRIFRGFTFGTLQGRFVSQAKSVCYTNPISLTIRTLNPLLIEKLIQGIRRQAHLYIGKNRMEVTHLQVSDRHIETDHIQIRMLTPITVYHTNDLKQTEFYRPDEKAFYDGIVRNAKRKFQYYTGADYADQFCIIPLFQGLPKRMFTVYKGSYITAWFGQYALSGSPEILDLLYQTGIGAKNAQGFGMFSDFQ